MKVFNLVCAQGHRFEGWFASENAYFEQTESSLVSCPLCADTAVTRLPSAPALHLPAASGNGNPNPNPNPNPNAEALQSVAQGADVQTMWMQMMRRVVEQTEDVGERFPEEARRIHYGEGPERGIRGRATTAETEALREEGIEVMPLPLPPMLKGPLQ